MPDQARWHRLERVLDRDQRDVAAACTSPTYRGGLLVAAQGIVIAFRVCRGSGALPTTISVGRPSTMVPPASVVEMVSDDPPITQTEEQQQSNARYL